MENYYYYYYYYYYSLYPSFEANINRDYQHVIQYVYVSSNFHCRNCTSRRQETKYFDCAWLARSVVLKFIATRRIVWDSAVRICFHSFLQLIEPQTWAPNYTYLQNIPNCKLNVFIADSCKSKFTSKIIIAWVAVTVVVAAIDLGGTVAFGMDYYRLKVTQPEYMRRYTD